MNLEQIKQLDKKHFMNVFGDRVPVSFTDGQGLTLHSTEGETYTDFFSGIAVCALGHSHPALVNAIKDQADKLIHCSNYYYNENQALLAEKLCEISFADKIFFTNSGAESNEGAIKLARAYYSKRGQSEKHTIISLYNSFHGRTLATVTATGQAKFQEPFKPLPKGFKYCEYNNMEMLEAAMTPDVCAVIVEPVMGEGGVFPQEPSYMTALRRLCDERDVLLIVDEVQTGVGRTGKMFAYEHFGITPDIMSLAKGLGGGFPMGALCATDRVATGFEPGDHGSTYIGSPLACAASLAVLNEIENSKLVENAAKMGQLLADGLESLRAKYSFIKEVRGKGLLLGAQLDESVNVASIKNACFEQHYLVGTAGNNVLRLLPALIVTESDVADFLKMLDGVFANI